MDLESFADALDASEMNAFYASINEEKKRLKAQDVCLFPWEIKEQENREEPLDKTERQERYEAAKKRYGIV